MAWIASQRRDRDADQPRQGHLGQAPQDAAARRRGIVATV